MAIIEDIQRRLAELVDGAEQERRQAEQVGSVLEQVESRAVLAGGAVAVTVDATGVPTGLELGERALRWRPRMLAARVLDCMRQAQAGLSGEVAARVGDNPFGARLVAGFRERFPDASPDNPPVSPPVSPPVAPPVAPGRADDEDFAERSFMVPGREEERRG